MLKRHKCRAPERGIYAASANNSCRHVEYSMRVRGEVMEIFQGFSARRFGCFVLWLSLSVAGRVGGSDLDTVGITQLRSAQPALIGTGIRVAQPEAGSPNWEVNPTVVGQPTS